MAKQPNLPTPQAMRSRHHQELARIAVVQGGLVAGLKKDQAATWKQIAAQEKVVKALRPKLEAWTAAHLDPAKKPSDDDLRRYVEAVEELHNLRLADNAAEAALAEHEETKDMEPPRVNHGAGANIKKAVQIVFPLEKTSEKQAPRPSVRILFHLSPRRLLGKAHIKGHYRTNPKTGKKVWVEPHEDKRTKAPPGTKPTTRKPAAKKATAKPSAKEQVPNREQLQEGYYVTYRRAADAQKQNAYVTKVNRRDGKVTSLEVQKLHADKALALGDPITVKLEEVVAVQRHNPKKPQVFQEWQRKEQKRAEREKAAAQEEKKKKETTAARKVEQAERQRQQQRREAVLEWAQPYPEAGAQVTVPDPARPGKRQGGLIVAMRKENAQHAYVQVGDGAVRKVPVHELQKGTGNRFPVAVTKRGPKDLVGYEVSMGERQFTLKSVNLKSKTATVQPARGEPEEVSWQGEDNPPFVAFVPVDIFREAQNKQAQAEVQAGSTKRERLLGEMTATERDAFFAKEKALFEELEQPLADQTRRLLLRFAGYVEEVPGQPDRRAQLVNWAGDVGSDAEYGAVLASGNYEYQKRHGELSGTIPDRSGRDVPLDSEAGRRLFILRQAGGYVRNALSRPEGLLSSQVPPKIRKQIFAQRRAEAQLEVDLGRPPTDAETGVVTGMEPEKVAELRKIEAEAWRPRAFPEEREGEAYDPLELVQDWMNPTPEAVVLGKEEQSRWANPIRAALAGLPRKMQQAIVFKYGIMDDRQRSDQDVGALLKISRHAAKRLIDEGTERIRQHPELAELTMEKALEVSPWASLARALMEEPLWK